MYIRTNRISHQPDGNCLSIGIVTCGFLNNRSRQGIQHADVRPMMMMMNQLSKIHIQGIVPREAWEAAHSVRLF